MQLFFISLLHINPLFDIQYFVHYLKWMKATKYCNIDYPEVLEVLFLILHLIHLKLVHGKMLGFPAPRNWPLFQCFRLNVPVEKDGLMGGVCTILQCQKSSRIESF